MEENEKSSRRKYLTEERFNTFLSNDFYHLKMTALGNRRLLWVLIGGLIIVSLIDRLFG